MKKLHSPNHRLAVVGVILVVVVCMIACKKDDEKAEEVALEPLIEKIETAYVTGCEKEEQAHRVEIETTAPKEIQESVRARLLSYQRLFESRYKVTRNLSEGYPVGVIPAVDACPAGSEKVKIFMDNQDNGNTTSSGWTGSWSIDGNGNTGHTFCVVYGAAFRFMTFNAPTEYLLLRLGNNKTAYMEPRVWNVYIDNEDNNNKNALLAGDFSPNVINKNGTNFQFWAIAGKSTPGPNQESQFPDLGFSYGVLGTFTSPVVGGAAGMGTLKTDDENNNNVNQLYSVDWATSVVTADSHVQGYGVDRTNDPGNTTFNIRRAR